MRATGNLSGVTFISPPRGHRDQVQWQKIITESGYFFTADAMRGFSSRILWDTLAPVDKAFLFVSSEQDTYTPQPRAYTVRVWTMAGGVFTIGGFGDHATRAAAIKALGAALQRQQARAN
jgi:hypothetical protein